MDDDGSEQSGQQEVGCVATTAMTKPFSVSLYLLNEHAFRKWKQGGLFHHDLGSRNKQRGLQTFSGRDYITKGLPGVGSKQTVCTESRHEPLFASISSNLGFDRVQYQQGRE